MVSEVEQRWYTIADAAKYLGLTEAALRTRIFRAKVRTSKLGQRTIIERVELDRLIDRG